MSLVRATLNRYNEVEYDDTEFELIFRQGICLVDVII